MSARLIHFLCLGCGLLLALPPAWCCWTPSVPQAEVARAACCHKESAPKPKPAAPPAQCPCEDLHTVAPSGPGKVAADLARPAPPAIAVVDSPRAGTPADAAPIGPPPSRPLHLLRCVWLC